jgi:hypothetical protein
MQTSGYPEKIFFVQIKRKIINTYCRSLAPAQKNFNGMGTKIFPAGDFNPESQAAWNIQDYEVTESASGPGKFFVTGGGWV